MSRKLLASLLLAFAAAACAERDAQSAADSAELARDLALATQTPVYPQFQDTAVSPPPVTRQADRAPARRPQPARAATKTAPVSTPRPRPSAPVETIEQPAGSRPALPRLQRRHELRRRDEVTGVHHQPSGGQDRRDTQRAGCG